eukprot:CAMPEP_0119018046 /NCGR_PEP_ID=MMETSP1176-20130426/18412_1 /TAXON_ID=265551 /ORGANISM="Synedropsis recta cf, Strain CCMP1620" /LENGTH=512 /DNA_ID=CAMNT_0006971947 /DNA_START=51 /DNA_END=1586 /DNA_ORIENTATION=+
MASTSSTAAAASMVIPFHCVICFDEFNFTDRTPMVLPCGHTYVCASCTKRLKRCMECRQPLFWSPPSAVVSPPFAHTQQSRAAPARYGRPQPNSSYSSSVPRSPPRKPQTNGRAPAQTTQLPMPRNVVMIAMMEAAQRSKISSEDREGEAECVELGEGEGEEGIEVSAMMDGLEALSGASGTYAVKETGGLAVLPLDPRKRHTDATLSINAQDPFNIQKGQTVQVVEVGEGVYKLARESGYIVASDSQLVKVGGPLDSSCRLEGMQDLVNLRKQALLDQLEKIERLSVDLTHRIDAANMEEPSHPIITDAPEEEEDLFEEALNTNLMSPIKNRGSGSFSSPTMSPLRQGQIQLNTTDTTDVGSPLSTIAPRTPNTIDNSDIGEYADENVFPGESPYLCSPFSFLSGSQDSNDLLPRPAGRSFEEPSRIRPRLSPSSQTRNGIAQSPSMGSVSVNFSTGMSGHRAMTSKSSRGQASAQRQIRMMGEHRGISLFRGPLKKQQKSASSSSSSMSW